VREPVGDLQGRLLMMPEPHRQRTQARQREKKHPPARRRSRTSRTSRAGAASSAGLPETRPEQQVGMAAEYLVPARSRCRRRARGAKEQRRRPGIVHEHDRVAPVRRSRRMAGCRMSNDWEPGASVKHRARVGPHRATRPGVERIEIGDLDAEALEHRVAENYRVGRYTESDTSR